MTKNEHDTHNKSFWSGLSLGVIVGASGLALFGTKKGRELVHKLLEVTDNFEETAGGFINDMEHEIESHEGLGAAKKAGFTAIESLLDKIQSIMPDRNPPKVLK